MVSTIDYYFLAGILFVCYTFYDCLLGSMYALRFAAHGFFFLAVKVLSRLQKKCIYEDDRTNMSKSTVSSCNCS